MEHFFENNVSLILFGIFLVVFLLIVYTMYLVFNQFKNVYSHYLNSLGNVTTSQIRSEISKNQRYSLIKNLFFMKKFFGYGLLAIIFTMIGLTTIIVMDSREYFTDYFEVQRQKLNLRSEASVDSLQVVIDERNQFIDSLKIININSIEKDLIRQEQITDFKTSINQLQSAIRHQNQMIKNYNKKITVLENLLKAEDQ